MSSRSRKIQRSRSRRRSSQKNTQKEVQKEIQKEVRIEEKKQSNYLPFIRACILSGHLEKAWEYIHLETPEKEPKPEYKKEWWTSRLLALSSPIRVIHSNTSDYTSSLSSEDQLTLYSYTEKIYGGGVHNYWLRGSEQDKKEVKERLFFWPSIYSMYYNRYFPYYTQVRRVLRQLKDKIKYYLKTASNSGKPNFDANAEEAAVLRRVTDGSLRSHAGFTEELAYRVILRSLHRFTAKFWDLVLSAFVEDLNRIIERGPPISSRTVVYRGDKGLFYSVPTDAAAASVNKAYLSTSRSKEVALEKVDETGCCILEMILEPGVRAIDIEAISALPEEREILVGLGHVLEVIQVEKPFVKLIVRIP